MMDLYGAYQPFRGKDMYLVFGVGRLGIYAFVELKGVEAGNWGVRGRSFTESGAQEP